MRFYRTIRRLVPAVCGISLTVPGGIAAEEPRLNEIQLIGSHNSYHLAPPAGVLEVLDIFHKNASKEIGRSMPPLTGQLDAGVRQFELDIHADPKGGLYAKPFSIKLAALSKIPVPPYDPDGNMNKPGFKLVHIPDIDCWSNNPTLASALAEISGWSLSHPGHLPLFLLIECKDEAHPPLPTRPVRFDRAQLMAMEEEILAVVPRARIFTPDDLRGTEKSLPDAIRNHGWPELKALRGKLILALDNTGSLADRYLEGNPALEGRLLFVSAADEKSPAAAWFKCNDPIREFDRIQKLVKLGFVVRTRADEGTVNPAMREKAFQSGAQWISTDHYDTDVPAGSQVVFKGGKLVRSNPLNGATELPIPP